MQRLVVLTAIACVLAMAHVGATTGIGTAAPSLAFFAAAACNPREESMRLDFVARALPDIDADLPAEADDDQDTSWRCDLSPTWSVTAKFRVDRYPVSMVTVWENGIPRERLLPIGYGTDYVTRSLRISAAGVEVCYWRSRDGGGCRMTARSDLQGGPDPYFTPGLAPGEPPSPALILPMRWLTGFGDTRCAMLAGRLARDWEDDFDDLATPIAWRDVEFPDPPPRPLALALAEFDIDNDGKPELVMREVFDSRSSSGERFSIWPMDSWMRFVSRVYDEPLFWRAIRASRSPDRAAHPNKFYDLEDPFGPVYGHYRLKPLTIDNRIFMFARSDEEPWMVRTAGAADEPTRELFAVQPGSGNIRPICTFAPPLRLGEQL